MFQNLKHELHYCLYYILMNFHMIQLELIQHLKPRGVFCVIDPSGNDDIHQWLDDDYNSYRLVHQVFTYSDLPDEMTPRIIWMTRRDVPIVKHSMPDKIKIMSPPVISNIDNLQNNCLVM